MLSFFTYPGVASTHRQIQGLKYIRQQWYSTDTDTDTLLPRVSVLSLQCVVVRCRDDVRRTVI